MSSLPSIEVYRSGRINHKHVRGGNVFKADLPGEEGDKSIMELIVCRNDRERRAGSFFVQRFKNAIDLKDESNPLQHQLKRDRLFKLGLPVVSLFYVDLEHKMTIRTDVTKRGRLKIFDTHHLVLPMDRAKITNLEQLKDTAREFAVTAYDKGNGVWTSIDAYAVVVGEDKIGELMFLDLGIGSHLLRNGYLEVPRSAEQIRPIKEARAVEQAESFVYEVLEGNGPPATNFFFGG